MLLSCHVVSVREEIEYRFVLCEMDSREKRFVSIICVVLNQHAFDIYYNTASALLQLLLFTSLDQYRHHSLFNVRRLMHHHHHQYL